MAFTGTMTQMVEKWREHTGRSQTTDISDSDVIDIINDYFVNYFSSDTGVDELNVFFTQALSATDNGIYPIAQSVDRLDDPVTINGRQIELFRDRELFFGTERRHHDGFHGHSFIGSRTTSHFLGQFEDEQFITDPGLAIGTDDTKKVKHDDFDYSINGLAYSKASSEVDLTGDAVPEDKYGAWSLRIDENGDITVAAADDNVTGYLTPRLALEALTNSDSDSAYMGYVTVIKSDGAFTPATTALNDSGVTDTFTDGRFETRTEPTAALLYGQDLYVRAKANDIYEFRALQIGQRPAALGASDAVADVKWASMIALGAAILFLKGVHDDVRADELTSTMRFRKGSIKQDKIKRLLGQVIVPTF